MAIPLSELLQGAPSNWGRWGDTDELGSVNYLTQSEVLRGVKAVENGKVFTLQVRMCHPEGDPGYKGRSQPERMMVMDKGHYLSGKAKPFPGGMEYADDVMMTNLQATTQFDALGHVWFDDKLYNGYDAKTTMGGGLSKNSILPVAEHGVVGRGILLDVARHNAVDHLEAGYGISLGELLDTAKAQNVRIQKHDILLIRTGWLNRYFSEGPEAYYGLKATDDSPDTAVTTMSEPGIAYSPELVRWFHEMEIPSLGSDTLASEQTCHPESGCFVPLHGALMRNLGILFSEINWLEDLAIDCAEDKRYSFLYACTPLKIFGAAGSPINPICVK